VQERASESESESGGAKAGESLGESERERGEAGNKERERHVTRAFSLVF
jgi:hypothetical protein